MATDYFLKVQKIKGESTDKDHKDWIEFESFSWGASQMGSGPRSTGGAASSERVDLQDITLTKRLDSASADLLYHCCLGDDVGPVEIQCCRATGAKTCYLNIKLSEGVVVSSYAPSGAGGSGELPDESVSFNFGKVDYEYTATHHETGQPQGSQKRWWSVTKNQGG